MRERKNSGDDYNKTHHVYADSRKLVQEIKRERGLSRQDSKKPLNVDAKATDQSKKDAKIVKGSKAISKPKSSSPSKVSTSSTLSPKSSKNLSHTIVPSKSRLTNSNDSSVLPTSTYTDKDITFEHEKSDPLISNVVNSTSTETQLNESINSNENTDAKVTVSKVDTTESPNPPSPQLPTEDATKSTTPNLAASSLLPQPSADTEANGTLSVDHLEQSTSESQPSPSAETHLERSSSPIIKKESPYAELPPRKDFRDENVQEKTAPPEPPPPRTSNGQSTLNSKLKSKPLSENVELDLGNVEVISTSSSTKTIDDMVRRRRKRRVFLILITAFLFCLLLGVAGVAVYLISLGRTDNEETVLQTSNQESN